MNVVRSFVLRFGTDCDAPARILLLGMAGYAVLAFLGWLYSWRCDRPEKLRRMKVLLVTAAPAALGAILLHFVAICSVDVRCPRAADLNCDGVHPKAYELLAVVFLVISGVAIVGEAAYRLHGLLRIRKGDAD